MVREQARGKPRAFLCRSLENVAASPSRAHESERSSQSQRHEGGDAAGSARSEEGRVVSFQIKAYQLPVPAGGRQTAFDAGDDLRATASSPSPRQPQPQKQEVLGKASPRFHMPRFKPQVARPQLAQMLSPRPNSSMDVSETDQVSALSPRTAIELEICSQASPALRQRQASEEAERPFTAEAEVLRNPRRQRFLPASFQRAASKNKVPRLAFSESVDGRPNEQGTSRAKQWGLQSTESMDRRPEAIATQRVFQQRLQSSELLDVADLRSTTGSFGPVTPRARQGRLLTNESVDGRPATSASFTPRAQTRLQSVESLDGRPLTDAAAGEGAVTSERRPAKGSALRNSAAADGRSAQAPLPALRPASPAFHAAVASWMQQPQDSEAFALNSLQWLRDEGRRAIDRRGAAAKPAPENLVVELGPGPHGLLIDGTCVIDMMPLPSSLGVKPGWHIAKVRDEEVHSGVEADRALERAVRSGQRYSIQFRKPDESLQYPGKFLCRMGSYVDKVKNEFKFQGNYHPIEKRAITLEQLQRVMDFVKTCGPSWVDQGGKRLRLEEINHYTLTDWLIKPATKEKECSMMELLAREGQDPLWFVSHWWGESVASLVRCVQRHGTIHSLAPSSSYWVFAYSARHHTNEQDVFLERERSGFYRAMQKARFRVLLVLDQKNPSTGPATPLNRLWCLYELHCCLEQEDKCLEVVTSHTDMPSMLATGKVEEENHMEIRESGSGAARQFEREQSFPLSLAKDVMHHELQLVNAKTTKLWDYRRILNVCAGQCEYDEPPEKRTKTFDQARARLRSFFAILFWRRVCLSIDPVQPGDTTAWDLKEMITKTLEADNAIMALNLCLSGCPDAPETVKALGRLSKAMPPSLRALELDLSNTTMTDSCIEDLIKHFPRTLEQITLNLSNCTGVTDKSMVTLWEKAPPILNKLSLILRGTSVSSKVREWVSSLHLFRLWDPFVNKIGKDGKTSLMKACINGRSAEIMQLLDMDAQVDIQDPTGCTALIHTIMHSTIDVATILLSKGKLQVKTKDNLGRCPLLHCVLVQNQEMAALMLSAGSDQVLSKDLEGRAVLSHALLQRSDSKLLAQLLEHYPQQQVSLQDNEGLTPLMHAVLHYKDAVPLLLQEQDKQVLKSDNEGRTALLHAILEEDVALVSLLLKHFPEKQVLHKDNEGQTALMYSAVTDNAEIASMLLEHMPLKQVLLQDNQGVAALSVAIQGGSLSVMNCLLDYHPREQVLMQDGQGETPLIAAINSNSASAVASLLHHHPKEQVNVPYNSSTPLRVAIELGCSDEIVDLLRAAGGKAFMQAGPPEEPN